MMVRLFNRLSYEATEVGNRSFVAWNVPMMNEPAQMSCMKWIIYWTADMKLSDAMKFSNYCVYNHEDHSFIWFHIRSSIYVSFHRAVFKWLSKVITWLRLLRLVTRASFSTNEMQNQNQSHHVRVIFPALPASYRWLLRIGIGFMALFALVETGRSSCFGFGFGFSTVI